MNNMRRLRHDLRRCAFTCAALALALCMLPALAGTAHSDSLPLWRVSDSAGHVLYLAGSMHALTAADYPLPVAFARAFHDSDRLVEELNLAAIKPAAVADAALRLGALAHGTLATAMGSDWHTAKSLAATAGIDLEMYSSLKPWLAGIEIADVILIRAGYQPALGLDLHFARLAARRKMPMSGLETVHQQLELLNDLEPALQRRFLLQTLREAPHAATELAALHAAWRHGDTAALESIERRDFKGYPKLRQRLLATRNRNWMPRLRACLTSGKTCFVAVGVEHMVGPDGLLARLRKAGFRVAQLRARQSG